LKILIVDDNASVRMMIRNIVRPLTCDICECSDGADAAATYGRERPDIVLMDIRMRDVDGITATKQIRATDPKAKVVIVTAFDDDDLLQAGMQAGACACVLKDDLASLAQLLPSFLDERNP
jgi:CheY-like chemotaxis protein